MTTAQVLPTSVARCRKFLEQAGIFLVLGALSGASIAFYLYACGWIARLQQMSPDQLVRAFTGV